jgi:hypothetical protein
MRAPVGRCGHEFLPAAFLGFVGVLPSGNEFVLSDYLILAELAEASRQHWCAIVESLVMEATFFQCTS